MVQQINWKKLPLDNGGVYGSELEPGMSWSPDVPIIVGNEELPADVGKFLIAVELASSNEFLGRIQKDWNVGLYIYYGPRDGWHEFEMVQFGGAGRTRIKEMAADLWAIEYEDPDFDKSIRCEWLWSQVMDDALRAARRGSPALTK